MLHYFTLYTADLVTYLSIKYCDKHAMALSFLDFSHVRRFQIKPFRGTINLKNKVEKTK